MSRKQKTMAFWCGKIVNIQSMNKCICSGGARSTPIYIGVAPLAPMYLNEGAITPCFHHACTIAPIRFIFIDNQIYISFKRFAPM
jgi:hypothetical protein